MALALKQKKIPSWKIEEVKELEELIKNSKTVLIANLEGFPADKLHEIRKKLRGKAVIKVTKNSLFEIAAKNAGIDIEKIKGYLTGPNAFIFTNDNPFAMNMFFENYKLRRYAMPGDKAEEDVIIPAGDTGMTAGPILSVFGKLKVQTRVQDGKVHVVKDTLVAKKGDPIPVEALPILQKLGIMPTFVKLKIKIAYHEGLVIPEENLKLDLDAYRRNIEEAYRNAFTLAVEIAYPEAEILRFTITNAVRKAIMLASELGYITPETAQVVFARAVSKAYALASAISGKVDLGIQIPKAETKPQSQEKIEEKKEEKKEEEKKGPSEEEIGGGLASLFG
ncbi:50S ribosomal protein L10 [Sulfolobus sp. A20]|uniref:50S ribosomal protein L10 n=1 Tax=Saccharolobus sp. A20 TaxID=1891280 RepID=UPI000846210E|nr:50S ribosomal protein L10 [Sulfolobus sp. A20]AOL16042.1 50S ribosomal protein L10 [Sulfolobus sp. A20]TRM73813.1 50S ribosomal protein L10 [Sulfolobus sp. E5]TRM75345.1 50S ribosomal protein L10 [Sulfolobus sp. A20-N-F8]TRM76258.1 50S ribosomal protein L10 [Sulfolobus sp. B5]